MRRSLTLLVPIAAMAMAACGGGDDTGADDEPFVEGPEPAVSTTAAVVTVPPGTCEDVPDAASYPEGQVPPVIPPCTPPAALVVSTIRPGTGRQAEPGDRIIIDYTGMRVDDGAVFDSSYTRDIPFDFPLGRGGVIVGWDEGLIGAQAGSMLRLDIPSALAYADNPPAGGAIRAGDDLSFVVEVRAVVAPTTEADAPLDQALSPSVGALGITTDDLVVGEGATVEAGDTAVVHMLLVRGDNLVVLFNSWGRSDPVQVVMDEGGSLPGVIEGLEGTTVGTRRIITMPPDMAFGPDGDPGLGLPAATDLIVVAEVVGVY